MGRFVRRGVYLGPEPGTTLVGVETVTPVDRMPRAMALALRCRSWRCICCAARLRRRARARALMGVGADGKARVVLMTLTIDLNDPRVSEPRNRAGKARPLDPNEPTAFLASETTRYAAWAWNRFSTYLKREYGHVPYFRGVELTQRGVAHLHVLLRAADSVEFMRLRGIVRGPEDDRASGLAVRAGFGPVVDMQLARSGGDVAGYVTKAATYVTKGLAGGMPRYTRRSSWSTSDAAAWAPGWVKPDRLRGYSWHLARASVGTVTDALLRSEFALMDPASVRASMAASAAGG